MDDNSREFNCFGCKFFIYLSTDVRQFKRLQNLLSVIIYYFKDEVNIMENNVASCTTILFVQIHMETQAIFAYFLKEMLKADI